MLELVETDEGGHYYTFDGERVPGVSEILESADVLIKNCFYEERKEIAAVRGRDVHMATVDFDRGLPTWWADDVDIAPYMRAYAQFVSDLEWQPTAIEKPCFHEVYRYAGTPDRFGSVRLRTGRKPVTLDIKCTSTIGPHVTLQLAGYNLFCDDHPERDQIALQLKPNGRYYIHNDPFPEQSRQVFLAALSLRNWKARYLKP